MTHDKDIDYVFSVLSLVLCLTIDWNSDFSTRLKGGNQHFYTKRDILWVIIFFCFQ